MKSLTKRQAISNARNQSKSKCNTKNTVYAWKSDLTNQYFEKGRYYISIVGPEKSFNIGGKSDIVCYRNGKVYTELKKQKIIEKLIEKGQVFGLVANDEDLDSYTEHYFSDYFAMYDFSERGIKPYIGLTKEEAEQAHSSQGFNSWDEVDFAHIKFLESLI